eukprot:jgi/Antlo1/105/984
MSQYVLCSSSSEEEAGEVAPDVKCHGDVVNTQYIFTRSLYCNSVYVGKNRRLTGLRISFSSSKSEHIKNRLKKTPPFAHLMAFMSFVEEPVGVHSFLEETVPVPHEFSLLCTSRTVGLLEKVDHVRSFKDLYSEALCSISQYDASENDISWIRADFVPERVILIQDTALCNLERFRTPFTVSRTKGILKLLFRGNALENLNLNDAIKLYGEYCIAQSSRSKEYRVFRSKNTILIVFSTSLFTNGEREFRLHKSVDCPKTCDVLVEENVVSIIDGYEEGLDQELDILNSLYPSEGEYLLFGKRVYRVDGNDLLEQNHIDYKSVFEGY